MNNPAEIVPAAKEETPSVTPTPMQVLVPAYFNPAPGWDVMTSSAKAHPDVKITAILNPQNGKFTNVNVALTNAIASFKLAGRNVVGYVSTNYAKRSLAEVKANIDNYLLHYPEVSGFFLDEMEAKGKQLDFYSDVANYIRDKGLNLQIIGNPGTLPVEAYTSVSDTLVTFEGKEVDYRSFNPATLHNWVYDKPNTIQAALVHNADNCKLMQQALTMAALPRTHTSLIYVTELEFDYSTGIGNPWKSLPKYWTQLLDSVDAINKQQPLPAC
ncbi:spherulation-specific family 4 protein [Comamonas suwonensis]|uniref:spherulation-specific family 4 protein n=1 Tax=Comamonas suwonensis TaxID=2606214 RepID=UPI00145CA696|nr:spherulation-specific family 4 protein [Comamonas suwonensis]MBI1625228.1 spherulation-specific family 4 protein [Comamonas suwonensis]